MQMPKTLYVKIVKDGNGDDEYLVADADASNLVEIGSPRKIGVYRLAEIKTGVATVELT